MPVNPDAVENSSVALLEPLETHYSHLAEAAVLIDLRSHPRFDTRFPAEATAGYGRKTGATITNLSCSGLRLQGSRKMIEHLFPDFSRQTGHTSSPLQVVFAVPGSADNHVSVKIQCKSAYIRQERKDTWQIGMAFTSFDAGEEALVKYLLLRGESE